MDTFAAAPLESEMLNCIGNVDLIAPDARFDQRAIEQLAGRSHKRLARDVFVVAGLLAHQHDASVRPTSSEHSLGCAGIQLASLAALYGVDQNRQVKTVGHERFG